MMKLIVQGEGLTLQNYSFLLENDVGERFKMDGLRAINIDMGEKDVNQARIFFDVKDVELEGEFIFYLLAHVKDDPRSTTKHDAHTSKRHGVPQT